MNSYRIVRKTADQTNSPIVECGYELCPFHQEKTVCTEAIERNQQLEFERNIEKLQIMKVGHVIFLNEEENFVDDLVECIGIRKSFDCPARHRPLFAINS